MVLIHNIYCPSACSGALWRCCFGRAVWDGKAGISGLSQKWLFRDQSARIFRKQACVLKKKQFWGEANYWNMYFCALHGLHCYRRVLIKCQFPFTMQQWCLQVICSTACDRHFWHAFHARGNYKCPHGCINRPSILKRMTVWLVSRSSVQWLIFICSPSVWAEDVDEKWETANMLGNSKSSCYTLQQEFTTENQGNNLNLRSMLNKYRRVRINARLFTHSFLEKRAALFWLQDPRGKQKPSCSVCCLRISH